MNIQRYWYDLRVLSKANSAIVRCIEVVALSWLYALCSQIIINLPFGLVPLSLQPIPLFIAASALGPTAIYAYILYYIQGLCGASFFSNAVSGIIHLIGQTGGYLIGFFFSMVFLSTFRKVYSTSYPITFFKFLIAECIFFIFGLFQLSFFVPMNSLFSFGLYPFIIGDLIKIAIGTVAIVKCKK